MMDYLFFMHNNIDEVASIRSERFVSTYYKKRLTNKKTTLYSYKVVKVFMTRKPA